MPEWCISKRELLDEALGPDTVANFAISEMEAWLRYPKHNWISNKLLVAQSQNFRCAPCEIWPEERDPEREVAELYPVVVKPMVNLFGMGVGACKVENSHSYLPHEIRSGSFWSEWLSGEFLSIDVLVRKGEPVWWCVFRGHQTEPWSGAFLYWESLYSQRLPPHLKKWMRRHLSDWTGCANFETIGGLIIEAHLRIGDLNHFRSKRLFTLLHQACSADISLSDTAVKDLQSIGHRLTPRIFLVPVFVLESEYPLVRKLSRRRVQQLCQDPSIAMVLCDNPPDQVGNPDGHVRLYNLTTTDLECGFEARDRLLEAGFASE